MVAVTAIDNQDYYYGFCDKSNATRLKKIVCFRFAFTELIHQFSSRAPIKVVIHAIHLRKMEQ